eukprot:scaffold65258_cov58-Attheya_sp.AAC.1
MILVLSLGITLGGRAARASKRELDIMEWHDACKYDQLSGKGWNRCLEQCELYVCCDFDGGCNADRAPLCDRYENWCATVRVTANSRGIRPSITPIDDYDEYYEEPTSTPFPTISPYPTPIPLPTVDEDNDEYYEEPTSTPFPTITHYPTPIPLPTVDESLDPTFSPSVSGEPTNDPTTTLPPTVIPNTSLPPTSTPSRAPVVAPKITPSPSKTPVTEAPVRNFKM